MRKRDEITDIMNEQKDDYNPYRETARRNKTMVLLAAAIVVVFFVVFLLFHFNVINRLVMNLILVPVTLVIAIVYLSVKGRR